MTTFTSKQGIELVNPVMVEQSYLDAKDARIAELEAANAQLKKNLDLSIDRIDELSDGLEALLHEAKECIDDEFGKCGLADRIDAALRSTKTEGDASQPMGD